MDMEYRPDFKIKYMTDTYKNIKGFPNDDMDIIVRLVDVIHNTKKTKLVWIKPDYVFTQAMFESCFDVLLLDKCIDSGIIAKKDDSLYCITTDGLNLVFV